MKLALGADHRGIDAATRLTERLCAAGHDVNVFVPQPGETCDYPDAAWNVATCISSGDAELGILLCGTGVGMCVAANKIPGIRAAPVHDEVTAEISRAHINANIICLSADLLGMRLIEKIIDLWLATPFQAGRHARRIEKIERIERGQPPTTEEA